MSSTLPVSSLALLDLRESRSRALNSATALLAARTDQLAGELDHFNEGYQRAAARLARVPEIVEFLSLPDDRGRPLLRSLTARLGVHINSDPSVRGIGLIDRACRVTAATEPVLLGASKAFRRYVQRGLEGAALISDPYIAAEGVPSVAYIAPVRGADGAVIGLVSFWIRAEAILSLARRANGLAGEGSYAVLYDGDGLRIAHSRYSELVFRPAGALPQNVVDRLEQERRFGAATKPLLEDVHPFPEQFERARSVQIDGSAFRCLSPFNQEVSYGVARRLTAVPWTVFYMVPEATIAAPISLLTRQRLIQGSVIGFFALALGGLLAAVVLRPVRRLVAATARLGAGELDARVEVDRRDELGGLGLAFNSMARQLELQAGEVRRSRAELEDLVRQRTSELFEANRDLQMEVAERARAEAAVREREQSLATTLDSIGDAVIVTDPAGIVVRMNPVAEGLTGWPRAEALGRPLGEVVRVLDEDTRANVELSADRTVRPGRANRSILLSRSGAERPIAESVAPIFEKGFLLRGVVLVFRDMTAEREAQRSIVASELKYRDLYESSPDMYLTAELPGELIVDCNATLCARLGYLKEELVGQPFPIIYHPDDRPGPSVHKAFQAAGEFIDVERRLRSKSGSPFDVSVDVRAIRDAEGKIVGARAVYRDIARRKQADRDGQFLLQLGETLRSSIDVPEMVKSATAQIGAYLDVSQCTFAEIDEERDRVEVHRGYYRDIPAVFGVIPLSSFGSATTSACARGETVVIRDTEADRRTPAALEKTYRAISVRAAIAVPMMRAGMWKACLNLCSHQPRHWEEREIVLLKLVGQRLWHSIEHLHALEDLRRREVDDAVRQSEQRFRALIEGVRDYAIFVLDLDGKVATWNAGAERMKGYAAEEIIGQHFSVFYAQEQLERDHPRFELAQARATGRYEEEGWRIRKDGSRFWANVTITSLTAPDGQLEGFAKITRDFTERRKHEEELQAKQAALAQSLKERTVLLQEVHHRVKNNLQVISSLINMQMRKLEKGDARSSLSECQTRVLAIALIHEKLYQSNDYAEVRFVEYARGLAANVLHATGISPQDITLELDIDDVPLGVDRAIPCGLVINELMTNSLKYAFKDGRAGKLAVALRKLPDGMLRLSVEDDGPGFPARFDIGKASSMGLQLVRTLAEQLDATVVVGSERGASVQLTFPGGA